MASNSQVRQKYFRNQSTRETEVGAVDSHPGEQCSSPSVRPEVNVALFLNDVGNLSYVRNTLTRLKPTVKCSLLNRLSSWP